MKFAMLLVGLSFTVAAGAQVRMNAEPPAPAAGLNAPRNTSLADPQIAQLKQQVAELKQLQLEQKKQLVELAEKNLKLAACLNVLKAEVASLKKAPGESVAVPMPQTLGANCN